MREAVARAICSARGEDPDHQGDDVARAAYRAGPIEYDARLAAKEAAYTTAVSQYRGYSAKNSSPM
ncbi:hypothetical protein C6P97_31015 [Burkholderia multivorans]|uniref:Bacteriophage protein n=1 Tax=Burkholderia multivorans TaxID=87883 RepID=A0AB37ALU4_9BURK|nr:hypothetical protein C6P97_31015 [Burkholderia multivorans]PRE42266.1 hypothetical protein C6P99_24590 [Burkholderia multivorans]